ncbi:MAG: riboflavin synthase [Saprospiraceae bacterium]|nr:riboflavin synthase [Pyrinomonadaceae bacterium]
MFTGIIQELGSVAALHNHSGGAKIKIAALTVTEGTGNGDSISVNGVCLTVLNITPASFEADVSQETLDRSTLGDLKTGSPVNLERAVTPSTRLGGHIVQGHVDGRGTFLAAVQSGDFWTIRIGFPKDLAQYFVYKGSVSVEGISLTIAALADDYFEIAVIPKTWELTNLSSLAPGDAVNLEADVIAKYVERIMQVRKEPLETITHETLRKAGFV